MARNFFTVTTKNGATIPCALAGTVAKTVVGILASTNVCVNCIESVVSYDGATSSNAPSVNELNTVTFATNGPGTNSTSFTPCKYDTGRAETVQATAANVWTTEPTVQTTFAPIEVGQFNGVYHWIVPFSTPFVIIGAKGVCIRATSPNAVNIVARISAEE